MSNEFTLNATARADVGKGASRRLRRLANEIPAIIYGAGKEPANISIPHKDILHAIENEAFFSHVITLDVDGKKEEVIIKDLQRHPAKPRVLHADFQRVDAKQAIHVKVPLHFINESSCVGVKMAGGQISHLLTELEITCLPKDLPEFIEVDVAELNVGESLHIADLSLPKGVTSVDMSHGDSGNLGVVIVNAPKRKEAEEGDAEASGEEGAAED